MAFSARASQGDYVPVFAAPSSIKFLKQLSLAVLNDVDISTIRKNGDDGLKPGSN